MPPNRYPDHAWTAEAPEALPNQPRSISACKFADRCPPAMAKCLQQTPPLYQSDPQQTASCFLYEGAPVLQAEKMDQVLQVHRAVYA